MDANLSTFSGITAPQKLWGEFSLSLRESVGVRGNRLPVSSD
jgi:hypothetical protein